MMTHPHEEQLSAFLDEMLDIRQMREVAQHLGVCSRCQGAESSLSRVKTMLRESTSPAMPDSDFWANTYRRMRTEGNARPGWRSAFRTALASGLPGTQRRWAAGVAAAAAIGLALAGPLLNPTSGTHPRHPITVSADAVDISSLVRDHTESAARQPLADADRQTMISADTDDAFGFSDVTADPAGDGGSFAADAAR